MDKAQTVQLLMAICTAYPMVEMTNERLEVWVEDMEEVPFDEALKLLRNHRRTEKFPPTISDFYEIVIRQKKAEREEHEEWLRLNGSAEPLWELKSGE